MRPRRAVLLTILVLAIGLLLLDVHGNLRSLVDDVRATWFDIHPADSTSPNG
jgi:hypothetical protein